MYGTRNRIFKQIAIDYRDKIKSNSWLLKKNKYIYTAYAYDKNRRIILWKRIQLRRKMWQENSTVSLI